MVAPPRSKKQKISHPVKEASTIQTLGMNAPVRKSQKLGDKITALQQLVSPFGKTDTASVLHEATICIRALHEQIQALSSPYFQNKSKTNTQSQVQNSFTRSSS
ncbi:putative transcription factor bHLH family [Dioscorea sansibarensis]